jgi:hypothetical protein
MKKLIFLMFITLVTGCEKYSFHYPPGLTGKWKWVNTCLLKTDICSTPESTNEEREMVFTSDSVYRYYVNDTLRERMSFRTWPNFYSGPGPSTAETWVIKWDTLRQALFSLNNNDLLMWDGSFAGWIDHYQRVQ